MPKVYNKKRVYRSQFRDLARGQAYWLSTNLATAPSVKATRTASLSGWTTTTGAPTLSTVADVSVAVGRVPQQFLGHNSVLA